ncbi:NlpC/P60 family protein [Actinomadura sp. DC4]|uniref:C40 family peptidase n=1 Tax=Actinomadura sp. DC4 TaxID=3055069 RepID=UPI0025B1BC86|nr:NlpC/P60 family protein [Actinomadura sp. DC4]MDN3359283.1 NlpC/P60 family protein [Actinomadura sp. DC4]
MSALTVVAAGAGTGVMFMAALIGGTTGAITAANGMASGCMTTDQPAASKTADEIPATYLRLYQAAGSAYGVPWTILASIGSIETHHGRDQRISSASARGPMQFMPGTWATYGLDGDADGRTDITDPADAIPSAARYLKASGAPGRLREAIYAYNHSWGYVANVIAVARRYAARPVEAADDASCGYVGPVQAPTVIAAKVIDYARAQLGKPYIFGGTGPAGYDCSGLTMMAYRAAGSAIPRLSDAQYWFGVKVPPGQEAPGDLVFFDYKPGHSGPGHVGIVYDVPRGLMLAAPHTGANVRVQSYRAYPGGPVGFTRPYAHHP